VKVLIKTACGDIEVTKKINVIDCSPKICKASINTIDSCQQKLVQFSVKADSAIKNVNWYFGFDKTRTDNFSNNLKPTYAYPKAGKYTIQLIAQLSCGFDTAFKEIEIIDCSPKICKANINTLDSCQQKLVQFSVKADSAIKSVEWFLGYDNTRADNFSTDLKPTYAYPKAGKYTIQLIAQLSCGFDTTFKEIEIVDCTIDTTNIQTFLPNVFTPNNDLLNDVFKMISNKNLEQFNLVIYNRWGQEVFSTNNYEQGWNGQYQDNDCPDGVYFYLISYSYKKNNYSTCGTVTLLR
jgi:gliding motility-associated-like protein